MYKYKGAVTQRCDSKKMQIVVSGYRSYARPHGAVSLEDREDILDCEHCGLRWTPARVQESYEHNGRKLFRDAPLVRCVECKATTPRPVRDRESKKTNNESVDHK